MSSVSSSAEDVLRNGSSTSSPSAKTRISQRIQLSSGGNSPRTANSHKSHIHMHNHQYTPYDKNTHLHNHAHSGNQANYYSPPPSSSSPSAAPRTRNSFPASPSQQRYIASCSSSASSSPLPFGLILKQQCNSNTNDNINSSGNSIGGPVTDAQLQQGPFCSSTTSSTAAAAGLSGRSNSLNFEGGMLRMGLGAALEQQQKMNYQQDLGGMDCMNNNCNSNNDDEVKRVGINGYMTPVLSSSSSSIGSSSSWASGHDRNLITKRTGRSLSKGSSYSNSLFGGSKSGKGNLGRKGRKSKSVSFCSAIEVIPQGAAAAAAAARADSLTTDVATTRSVGPFKTATNDMTGLDCVYEMPDDQQLNESKYIPGPSSSSFANEQPVLNQFDSTLSAPHINAPQQLLSPLSSSPSNQFPFLSSVTTSNPIKIDGVPSVPCSSKSNSPSSSFISPVMSNYTPMNEAEEDEGEEYAFGDGHPLDALELAMQEARRNTDVNSERSKIRDATTTGERSGVGRKNESEVTQIEEEIASLVF
eukprot:Nk52_evm27s2118 gene=Nk52_evmTU27s2118